MRLRLLAAFALLSGCAGANSAARNSDPDEPPEESAQDRAPGEAAVSVDYADSAESNWARGEEEFADENYLAAQKYFAYVKTKFPYSKHALPAELRVADCMFARQRFIESIDAYQTFVRLHPTHEKVPYAMLRAGMSFYEQIPGDWFLIPPSEEKDQASVRDAEKALAAYVDRFPKDAGYEEGHRLLTEVRKRLVAHERYAADFYRIREKPRAWAGRLEVIRKTYSEVALDSALLLELATAWDQAGEVVKAKNAAQELVSKFPGTPEALAVGPILAKPDPVESQTPVTPPSPGG